MFRLYEKGVEQRGMCGVGFCLLSQPGLSSFLAPRSSTDKHGVSWLTTCAIFLFLSLFSFACIFFKIWRYVFSPCPFSFLSALAKVDSADSPDSLIWVSSSMERNWAVLHGCLSCRKGVCWVPEGRSTLSAFLNPCCLPAADGVHQYRPIKQRRYISLQFREVREAYLFSLLAATCAERASICVKWRCPVKDFRSLGSLDCYSAFAFLSHKGRPFTSQCFKRSTS